MVIQDIIARKRDGGTLTRAHIEFAVQGMVEAHYGEEQLAALLMAMYIQGMTEQELFELTDAMARSGAMLDLSSLAGTPVDKHSTGGVGDKLTLVVAPLAASMGVPVAKMSGRGLGHTGGTLDKLEAIPGFRTDIDEGSFLCQVQDIGLAVIGQSSALVPADKIMYDVRNRTATVSSLPLIASSIMSKKLASGCPALLLDVTVGSGAFMKNMDDAQALAKAMVDIGQRAGRKTVAILTSMEEPLGLAIGNALEVAEAISTLHGHGPSDVHELSIVFAAEMAVMAGLGSYEAMLLEATENLCNGKAWDRFRAMVAAQGGDLHYVDNPSLLQQGGARLMPIRASSSGYVSRADALALGEASLLLGAGRLQKSDVPLPEVGIVLSKKTGQVVECGEPLCWLYVGSKDDYLEQAVAKASTAFSVEESPAEFSHPLVLGRISSDEM